MENEFDLKLLPMSKVAERLGCDKSTIYKLIRDGKFPQGRRLPHVPGVKWLSSEIDKYIMDQWNEAQTA